MENWINNLKTGDIIFTTERHSAIPGGEYKFKSKVIAIDSNSITTEYTRPMDLIWLNELTVCLDGNHRTFDIQTVKNYFDPNGKINISEYIPL